MNKHLNKHLNRQLKQLCVFILFALLAGPARAEKSDERFTDAEANFQLVKRSLLERYIDKGLSEEDLYRAAAAGMLESLNAGEESWNRLLSPDDFQAMRNDLTGQVVGIGTELAFDRSTGYARILRVIPKTPGEKAGLKKEDQILSIDGRRYKDSPFVAMIGALRGKAGTTVELKVLRDDKILTFNIRRQAIPWTPVELAKIDAGTFLLFIGYFNEETPKLVEEKLSEFSRAKGKKLIIDLRDNSGGGFDQAVRVAELFIPKGTLIAKTIDRDGKGESFVSGKGLLTADVHVVAVANKGTSSGAELMLAALKESRGIKFVGESTFGKWNAQTVETLPNGFAMKFTVKTFRSPRDHSFQATGLKPDVEVALPKDTEARELRLKWELPKLLAVDSQLKAAVELINIM